MKCPKCNGRGTVGYFHIDHFVEIECDRCNGSGEVSEVEQTNEEYLRSCDTEQLAESLLNIMANNEFTLYLLHTEKKSMQEMKDAVVEWLKQPHSEVRK